MAETKRLMDFLDILEEINKFARSFENERHKIGRDLQGTFTKKGVAQVPEVLFMFHVCFTLNIGESFVDYQERCSSSP